MYSVSAIKTVVDQVAALGEIAINSEHTMVIHGYEYLAPLSVNITVPNNLPKDNIPVALAGGIESGTTPQPNTFFTSPITFITTTNNETEKLFRDVVIERLVNKRHSFDFTIYRGTPENHTMKWPCTQGKLFGFEPTEVDAEDRTSVFKYTGQISYHHFGSREGNI